MSERYGPCRRCWGQGFIWYTKNDTLMATKLIERSEDSVTEELTYHRTTVRICCPMCGGTGFSGDAMLDYKP